MKLYTVIKYVFNGGVITPETNADKLTEVTINTIRSIIGSWAVPVVRQSVNHKLVSPYLIVDLAALGFARPGEEFTDLGKHFVAHDLDVAVATAVMYDQQRRDRTPDTGSASTQAAWGKNVQQFAKPMKILPKKRP